jgi:conjugal transfer pilin signal peptidase TrbI
MVGLLGAAIASHNALAAWQESHSFMINASESLPNWAFYVSAGKEPDKGDYVFFVPPPGALVSRHFGPDQGPFGKQVIGMPGAVIEHRGEWVYVDGVKVAHMKPRTRLGEPLHPGPAGIVPQDCYYVGTDHPDGFDSRYAEIGFACRDAIVGTGIPIL